MKLLVTIEVGHDLLDLQRLVRALPLALASVGAATEAGVAATGPDGMQVQVPGSDHLARVRFTLRAEETAVRIDELTGGAQAVPGSSRPPGLAPTAVPPEEPGP